MHKVQGVVARGNRSRWRPSTSDPGLVSVGQVQTCGVCHTDLHYREGGINDDFPFLLRHEAAGFVESVGDSVWGARRLRGAQLARSRRLPGLPTR